MIKCLVVLIVEIIFKEMKKKKRRNKQSVRNAEKSGMKVMRNYYRKSKVFHQSVDVSALVLMFLVSLSFNAYFIWLFMNHYQVVAKNVENMEIRVDELECNNLELIQFNIQKYGGEFQNATTYCSEDISTKKMS